jgi:Mg2+-importing ATPase
MTFVGFLVFFDPPKPGIIETIRRLRQLGVMLKIITGDSQPVAAHVGQQVGLARPKILTGADLHQMSNEALFVPRLMSTSLPRSSQIRKSGFFWR